MREGEGHVLRAGTAACGVRHAGRVSCESASGSVSRTAAGFVAVSGEVFAFRR